MPHRDTYFLCIPAPSSTFNYFSAVMEPHLLSHKAKNSYSVSIKLSIHRLTEGTPAGAALQGGSPAPKSQHAKPPSLPTCTRQAPKLKAGRTSKFSLIIVHQTISSNPKKNWMWQYHKIKLFYTALQLYIIQLYEIPLLLQGCYEYHSHHLLLVRLI